MEPRISPLPALAAATLLALSPAPRACTLYAAAGDAFVQGGGVIAVKVRDERPWPQVEKEVRPESGYAYRGLFTGRYERFNTGVNSAGLFVGLSTAGSVPKSKRDLYPPFRDSEGLGSPEHLIRYCATVDEAIERIRSFTRPANYLLADRTKAAVVEILPDGNKTVRVIASGTIAHTNHYIEPDSERFNERLSASSHRRLERIRELLSASDKPLSLGQMEAFSRDRSAGPDNSIWRTGSIPGGTRTLAVAAVHLKPRGGASVRLTYLPDPKEPESFRRVEFDL